MQIVVDPMLLDRSGRFSTPFTRQTEWCVRLRNKLTPKGNGSILEALMCSQYLLPSVVRLGRNSFRFLSQLLGLGAVNSEHRRKPKKATVNAAQYI